jgi:hypothetical protein
MKKILFTFTACFLLTTTLSINMSLAKNMYNPEDITNSYIPIENGYEKSHLECRDESISKILKEYDNKVYVKQYSSLDELKSHLVSEGSEAVFYDPEISDKKISFRKAYRVEKFSDVFEAVFVDYEGN